MLVWTIFPRFVSLRRDDLRDDNQILVNEEERSRDRACQQRRLHQLLKLPHSVLMTGEAAGMAGVMRSIVCYRCGGKADDVQRDEPEHQHGNCRHPAGHRNSDTSVCRNRNRAVLRIIHSCAILSRYVS